MRIEYDAKRDLLYIYFADPDVKAEKTITIMPGVYADFSRDSKLIGIEILDASGVLGDKKEVAVELIPKSVATKRETVPLIKDKQSR